MQIEPNDIGGRIKLISNALCRMRNEDIVELGLTSSQSFVMGYLNHFSGERISPGDIGKRFGMKQPTVTGILRRLEEKGFVCVLPDSADARRKTVAATEKSLNFHAQILKRIQKNEQMIVSGMTARETQELGRLLDKVIKNVQATGVLPEHASGEEVHRG